ncbi:MAG: hypothetical protein ABSH35_19020 [Isosphaeraceae bacterium]|jgi:hypothetical protein
MGPVPIDSSGDVEKDHTGASQAGTAAAPQIPEGRTVTYQLILRHLAKFRDGATALLDLLFATQAPAADADRAAPAVPGAAVPGAAAPAVPRPAEQEPKSPLEIRIERHMSRVDQALRQIRDLNPEGKKKLDLAPEVRDQIITKERTIHDIVGAELHFWSAAIANSPLDKFDQTEQAWARRIIRLAKIIGVDAEHKEHLEFLEDWASQEHS